MKIASSYSAKAIASMHNTSKTEELIKICENKLTDLYLNKNSYFWVRLNGYTYNAIQHVCDELKELGYMVKIVKITEEYKDSGELILNKYYDSVISKSADIKGPFERPISILITDNKDLKDLCRGCELPIFAMRVENPYLDTQILK